MCYAEMATMMAAKGNTPEGSAESSLFGAMPANNAGMGNDTSFSGIMGKGMMANLAKPGSGIPQAPLPQMPMAQQGSSNFAGINPGSMDMAKLLQILQGRM